MKTRLMALTAVCLLALSGCQRCDEPHQAPAPAQEGLLEGQVMEDSVPFVDIQGEGWAASVPADWERREEGVYVGPDLANAVIRVRDVPLPLELLGEGVLEDMKKAHQEYQVLGRHEAGLNGLRALELHGRYTRGSKSITHHTVVVEGGLKKYILTLSVVTPDYPANQALFARVIKSFRGTFVAPASQGEP